jgi:hypothetical protein
MMVSGASGEVEKPEQINQRHAAHDLAGHGVERFRIDQDAGPDREQQRSEQSRQKH